MQTDLSTTPLNTNPSSIELFMSGLIDGLRAQLLEPDALGLADVLWLTSTMVQSAIKGRSESGNDNQSDQQSGSIDNSGINEASSRKGDLPQNDIDASDDKKNDGLDKKNQKSEWTPNIPLIVRPQTSRAESDLLFRSPAAVALPGSLDLARAFKPLKRYVPSRTSLHFDEDATIVRFADERILAPVLRAAPSRWLDVALVVDSSPSMDIWQQTANELRILMERHGAFRDVRSWKLDLSDASHPQLVTKRGTVKRPNRALLNPAGHRMIVAVSDCVSTAWYGEALQSLLAEWGRVHTVVLAHVLPPELWANTALGDGTRALVTSPIAGLPNAQMRARSLSDRDGNISPNSLVLPVMTLDSESISFMTRMIAGSSCHAPAYFMESSELPDSDDKRTPDERVRDFKGVCSPTAFELACLLSAAPLHLQVMRLVQQTHLPRSRQSHLAEVILGGLMKRISTDLASPDEITFAFHDGVREALSVASPLPSAVAVLKTVSEHISKQYGSTIDFQAYITEPDQLRQEINKPEIEQFALISAQVLKRMGGRYAEAAKKWEGTQLPLPPAETGDTREEVAPKVFDSYGELEPKVFISYSYDSKEHGEKVLALADSLMSDGIDVILDQYEPFPDMDWPLWMETNLNAANFVLMICTEAYHRRVMRNEEPKGLGVRWEGKIILNLIYSNDLQGSRYIPILFEDGDVSHIPTRVQGNSRYVIQKFNLEDSGYESLYRHLTNQQRTPKPILGQRKELTSQQRGPQTNQPLADPADSIFTVPYGRNPVFTGREDVLANLRSALDSGKPTAITHPLALSGLGGVGKTQTAVEYAYRYRDRYQHIFWVRAETAGELQNGFQTIAENLQIPTADPEQTIRAVHTWLQIHSGWLLVFDSANDLGMVRSYIPHSRLGHVLLTTRARASGNLASRIRVQALAKSEGALLLLRRAQVIGPDMAISEADADSQKLALEISKEMDGLPLALDQAGAYIEETGCSLARYLELYRHHGAQMLDERGELDAQGHPSVTVTFTLAFANLEKANPAAADLIRCCAFLAADAIPEEIFLKGAAELGKTLEKAASNPLTWEETVKEACAYSMLNRESDSTYGIHRLVQVVIQNAMGVETQKRWKERIAVALSQVFPVPEYASWGLCERLINQSLVCIKWIHECDIARNKIASLLNNCGHYLLHRARFIEAEPLLMQALNVRKTLLGVEHLDTALSMQTLEQLYVQLGRYGEAERLQSQVLSIYEKVYGSDHPDTLTAMSNLGAIYNYQRKFIEAEPLLKRALAVREKIFGPEHPDTAMSLEELSRLFGVQGRYAEAEAIQARVLAIREKLLGFEHPDTMAALNNLGLNYAEQGKYVEAEPLLKRALESRERVLGPEHSDIAFTLGNLAWVYSKEGKHAEAEALQIRTLAIREKVYGPEHPHTLAAMSNLGIIYAQQGQYIEAEPLLKRALEGSEKVLGPDHPNTASAANNLRWFDERLKNAKESL